MKPRKRNLAPLAMAGAAGIAAYLWSQKQATAATVDPRWLAQQELARRQALASQTAGTDTLGMILKIGGSAATLGTTVYSILKKVFDTGTNADAVSALTRYISGGPTDLTTGIDPSMSLSDMVRTWNTTPTITPGTPDLSIPGGEVAIPYEVPLPITETPVQIVPSDVPTLDPPIPAPQTPPVAPTDLSLPPTIDAGLTIPSYELIMPGSVFSPSSLDGASGAVMLQSDGLLKLSLTAEEVEQASNIVALWESGNLDLSLLPPDKAAFLTDNLPTLKAFTESGDFGANSFSSPVSGDTLMKAMPADATIDAGSYAPSALKSLLDTPTMFTKMVPVVDEMTGAVTMMPTYATIGDVLQVVGPVVTIVVACVSMYFTITGDLPDYQKAIYCALDAASIAAVFIPVVGWIVAAVIQIVKFVLQKVLGQSKSHEQREAEETAYLLQYGAQELAKQLNQIMTLRQLYDVLTSWGSGSTGGTTAIAIVTMVNGKMIGVSNQTYAVATLGEFVQFIDTLTVRIQGGVAPEFLSKADASLRSLIQAIVPIMAGAKAGDFDATTWLVNRALALYIPAPHPQLRLSPSVRQLTTMFSGEYPWWTEVVLQTAYTLQANVWHYPTWLAMVNGAISHVIGPTTIEAWGSKQLIDFSKVYGFTDFRAWRDAFFAFEEPVSLAYLEGSGGMDKVYELQKQVELIANAMLGVKVPITDYDDLANALHAQYASVVSSVYVPDYSISDAWTAQLGPTVTVGYWRLPTAPGWEEYVHGTYQARSLDQVKALLQQGAMPMIYHRPLTQWLTIADPNDPSRKVPNPVFLVPNAVAYF